MTGSLRFHLRAATQAEHERLDAMVGSLDSRAAYERYLRGSHGYRAASEQGLEQAVWPAHFGDWRPTKLLDTIAQDLADLGLPLPPVPPLALAGDIETLIGTAYVLEGSALGAQLLVRQAQALGYDAAHGARHLHAQAGNLGRWRAFLDLIESAGAVDRERAAQAARASFGAAAGWMMNSDEPNRDGRPQQL